MSGVDATQTFVLRARTLEDLGSQLSRRQSMLWLGPFNRMREDTAMDLDADRLAKMAGRL
jgi:hypothetical protein